MLSQSESLVKKFKKLRGEEEVNEAWFIIRPTNHIN